MDATSVDLPGAVLGFAAVHLGLRAEAAGIHRLVDEGHDAHAERRARLLARVLSNHHHVEDGLLFPAIEARQPGFAVTSAELDEQHRALDLALAQLMDDTRSIDTLVPLLETHLQAEEQRVLPVWLASFTAAEHDRFGRQLRRSTPLGEAGVMISWLLDVSPEATLPLAVGHLPTPLRLAHRCWWRTSYERRYGAHGTRPSEPFAFAGAFSS